MSVSLAAKFSFSDVNDGKPMSLKKSAGVVTSSAILVGGLMLLQKLVPA